VLEVSLLGPFEARLDGRPVALRPKQRALLAALALRARDAVTVDRLVDDLWGEQPPPTATASLQNAVSLARRTLGTEVLVTRTPGYALVVDRDQVDALRFERLLAAAQRTRGEERAEVLRRALALWRGPALADLVHEPFARTEAPRLDELRASAREQLVETELTLGRHEALVPEIEALIEFSPFRERPRAQLMLALYRSGRQAEALEAFAAARNLLRDELGLEPSATLRTLQQAILRQDPALDPPDAAPLARMAGEERRKTVTVAFCDVVDSTSLGAVLDPEAFRAVLRRYYRTARAVFEQHGGTVEKFVGDAVVAVFGVPAQHEDDALRAVRAVVELQESIAELNAELERVHGVAIEVRAGVNTGEVVAGDPDSAQSFATGHALNVAAKLQQAAAAGETFVGAATFRLVRDAVRAEPVAPLELGARAEPVPAFRIVELTGMAGVARNLTAPLVGRERELTAMLEEWEQTRNGRSCRVVCVVGEAGIGKTRLARELVATLRDEATVLVGRCVSYGAGATYLPVAELLRSVAPDPSEDALTALLGDADDARLVARRLRELTALAEGTPPPGEGFWAVRRFLEELARTQPVALFLDDVHWAEPTLLELVDHVADHAKRAPILVVCLAREVPASWERHGIVRLGPLSDDESAALLGNLAELDDDVRRRIVATAEGNALFAEQLLAHVVEAGDDALYEVPGTIEALLASRLDRLSESERAVLERAAVVGRVFWRSVVDALSERDTREQLDELAARGLVRPSRSQLSGEDAFGFYHALIRDVAYAGITKERRSKLHERVAAWLDERESGWDEIVGHHLEQAYRLRSELGPPDDEARALAEAAGGRLADAGIRAWKRADAPATVNLLTRAVALLPTSADRAEALCELAGALWAVGAGSAARDRLEEAVHVARAARSRRTEWRARMELAYAGLYRIAGLEGTSEDVLDAASAAVPVLEKAGDDRALGRTWFVIAEAQNMRLNNQARAEASAMALPHYRRAGFSPAVCLTGQAAAFYYGATPAPEALRRCRALIEDADGDRQATAGILVFASGLHAMRNEFDDARRALDLAQETFEEHGAELNLAGPVLGFRAGLEVAAGDAAGAERLLRESRHRLLEMGFKANAAPRTGQLADLAYRFGRLDEAEQLAEEMRGESVEEDLANEVDWRRIRARVLARRGEGAEAEALARDALGLLVGTDALNQRARATLDVAEVLTVLDRPPDEVRALVEDALRLYRRKGNLADAARTRALLGELATAPT
jgi:DNA-binding SARP family transcriptional activator